MVEKRNEYIDIARGFSMITIIISHIIGAGYLRTALLTFNIPIFIITSGFFYKQRGIKDELIKNIKQILPTMLLLIIVYIIKNIDTVSIYELFINSIKIIVVGWSHESGIKYDFPSTSFLWFIYLLVGIRLLFYINKKIAKQNEMFLLLLVLLESYIGYILGIKGYWLPWSLDIVLASIIFYYFGYIMNKHKLLNNIISHKKNIIILIGIWILGIYYCKLELAIRVYESGLWSFIIGIIGTLLIIKLSYSIKKIIIIRNILRWCGQNSILILYGHYIENSLFYASTLANNLLMMCIYRISFAIIFTIIIRGMIRGYTHLKNSKIKLL